MIPLCTFDLIRPHDLPAVGGKALSLGLLACAGLPVPPGFCLTTAAYRNRPLADGLAAAVADAYRALGCGPVAVRSSATAEDGAAASFAGQQETILGVEGEQNLLSAIEQCWASLHTARAIAYRRHQSIAESDLAMAVVVQRLIPAEVAGVLFTRDPLDPSGKQMLVEASWGLGESVVSGKVTPDRFHLDRDTGRLLDQHINVKTIQRTAAGEEPVSHDLQSIPCLDEKQLAELAELGRKVEAFYREPRDIEWAFACGQFWLLQARPITASGHDERDTVRQGEIDSLRVKADSRGTIWSRYNLAEVLPEPTPMTWAIVQRYLMSGKGGFGRMYKDLGYDPDPGLDDEGIFDLVCGRPYCNLSREPLLYGRHIPYEHPFKALKADPRRALYPTPVINPRRFSAASLVSMPLWLPPLMVKQITSGATRRRLMKTFADRFRAEIAPAFRDETARARETNLDAFDDGRLLRFLDHWIERTLGEFARHSLKPTALAALALADLEEKLAVVVGPDWASEIARDLVMGVHPDPEADLPGAMRDVAENHLSRADFLAKFGHRGSEEMELSRPRWEEDPDTLERIAPVTGTQEPLSGIKLARNEVQHGASIVKTDSPRSTKDESRVNHGPTPEDRLANIPRLADFQRDILLEQTRVLHTYLGLRETGKHYLMYGYSLIRRALLEIDRRGKLHDGVFFLTPEELPQLLKGKDLSARISERRRRRSLALGLEVPSVLFSDDLEAIGRPVDHGDADMLQGVPISAGVAEAVALVLEHPHAQSIPAEGYILVCPSTDPAWVPLFVRAKGLVMETGGVLSHGAIVAREYGLPAVAGLPGVLHRIKTGQRLRVDGTRGLVSVLG